MSARLWIIQIMFMKLGWVFIFCICIWMRVIYSNTWRFKSCLKIVFPKFCCQPCLYPVIFSQTTSGLTTLHIAGLTEVHQCICINFHLTATSRGSLKDNILGFICGCTIQDKLCMHTLVPRPCWSLWYQGNHSKGVAFWLASKICQHILWLHFTHTDKATFCLLYTCLASWGLAGFWQMCYQYISL